MPNFLVVATRLINVSQALSPAWVRGPKLTSRLRTRRRASNSAGLLCSGISGCFSTINKTAFLSRVLAIRASNAAYPLLVAKRRSNSASSRAPSSGDGWYTGPTAEQACEEHGVELRPTRLRGGQSSAAHWGWEDYTWEMDEEGQPVRVTCPEGVSAPLEPERGQQRYIARFGKATCEQCPYFKQGCRVESRVHKLYGFYVKERTFKVAQQRQQVRSEDRRIRAGVEATMRSLKHPCGGINCRSAG